MSETERTLDADSRQLKELGYDQELERSWGQFTNFAISFSIISILAGCFTTYGQAWNNGGPIAISWGWPIISAFILIIGFCMSEILSAFPTAGGIYYWSLRLGGPAWGWFTGWFNLVGLIGVVASVDYGCALFASYTLGLFDSSYNAFDLTNIFIIYIIFLILSHDPEHVPQPHPQILEQHVGVLAYRRAVVIALILIFGAGRPPEHLVRVHRADQQLGLRRGQATGSTSCRSGSC